jgi:hypothetical protein
MSAFIGAETGIKTIAAVHGRCPLRANSGLAQSAPFAGRATLGLDFQGSIGDDRRRGASLAVWPSVSPSVASHLRHEI